MKSISIAIAALVVAGWPTLASAQSAQDYWGGYGGRPAPPPDAAPYDDGRAGGRYDDRDPDADRGSGDPADDDRYPPSADRGGDDERYFDRRDGDPSPDVRRYGNRRDDDQQNYGDRRDEDDRNLDNRPDDGRPDVGPPDDGRLDDRRYDDRRSGDFRYGDPGDSGQWDAAPSRAEEERLSKTPGTESGTRPYIQPVAPPQVAFSGPYAPGSIVIDTSARKLYYVLSTTSAYAYPIGVGRQGFTWTGKEKVSRVTDWPDWYPPADMRKRKPELPVRMLGGIRNPLGAKAIYLGNTLYRIHGTNDPKSIGKAESSGCFRMMNENVLHLASLVQVGTEVTIVRSLNGAVASAAKTPKARVSERTPQPRADPRERYEYGPYSSDGDWR
jgi:lipoprotein-anchoring transpeptidase ErfK/SrfK